MIARPSDFVADDRLSLAECRALLGDEGRFLTDEQLLQRRDQLYTLADVLLSAAAADGMRK